MVGLGACGGGARCYVVGPEFNGEATTLDDGRSFGNAGVMLLNVPAMRRSYSAFLDSTFSAENLARGFTFQEMGPGDQGAYNTYYQVSSHPPALSPTPAWKRGR